MIFVLELHLQALILLVLVANTNISALKVSENRSRFKRVKVARPKTQNDYGELNDNAYNEYYLEMDRDYSLVKER